MVALPGAEDPAEGDGYLLECALGSYTSGLLAEWQLPVEFDAEGAASRVAGEPDVWTDGSLVHDKVPGASSSGSVFLVVIIARQLSGLISGGAILMMIFGGDRSNRSCRGYCSVRGRLQTVQRAEFWGVILALQAADAVHFGVDNPSVVRHTGRLLDGNVGSRPAELVKDGDLVLLIGRNLEMRGRDTVLISEVKGHADEGMVREGGVRELDRLRKQCS